jgi:hypothetical protein
MSATVLATRPVEHAASVPASSRIKHFKLRAGVSREPRTVAHASLEPGFKPTDDDSFLPFIAPLAAMSTADRRAEISVDRRATARPSARRVPTDSEKFTLVTGFAFKRVIESLNGVRWLSFRLAETLTLEGDSWVVLAWLLAG